MALAMSAGNSQPLLREYMLRRIGAGSSKESLATLVRGLGKTKDAAVQLVFLDALRSSLSGQRQAEPPKEWSATYAELSKSSDSNVRLQAQSLGVTFGDEAALSQIRKLVLDRQQPTDARIQAVNSLLGAKDPKLAPALLSIA